MPLPLSPSLSAPSVSPDISAVVLPLLSHPSVAVQNPLPSPQAAPHAAAVRAEAVKTIADWKASRSVPTTPSAKSVAPSPSADNPSIQLDALFDGSLPASREVLFRADSLGLNHAALARALADSKSPTDAAARLSALGILGSHEAGLVASREDDFRFLLTRLWRKTSASIPAAFPIDASFDVPALTVKRGAATYFVHPVVHGQYGPPRRRAVLALVRKIEAAGEVLYSEQNLPAYYGYTTGYETLDHAASDGAPIWLVPAARDFTSASLRLKRAIDWAVAPGSALAALAWALISPAAMWAWILLPVLGVLAWLTLTGGLPWMRWKRRLRADTARADGHEDIAEQYADEADNFFVAKPDLSILGGLELPQPLGAQPADRFYIRSHAIADAVAADVAATGASTAHIVVGHMHAHEVAYRLADPGPKVS